MRGVSLAAVALVLLYDGRGAGHVTSELGYDVARQSFPVPAGDSWGVPVNAGRSANVVAVPLRSAYRFATDVGAVPLQRRLEALAAIGKISLDEPVVPSQRQSGQAPFDALTKREREVPSHLVVGRTYAEIAGTLFISEKTVSAHVSNLLRKTGTSSRREVSALAVRLRR